MTHSIPREAFEILEDTFHSREKAKKFAEAIEEIILYSQQETKIEEKKNILKIELKEELKNELVTRELFEERFKTVDEKFNTIDERFKNIDEQFKILNFKFNLLITLVIIALTFANPTFVAVIEKIFKL
jgi:hypothetical protein